MTVIGTVESVWRYPVKSMRGEALDTAYLGFAGLYGDRVYAFGSDAAVKGFPYLTGREQRKMLLYRPRFRHPEKAAMPPNLTEAESLAPGISPLYAQADDLAVEIETPSGETLAIDDPVLMQKLNEQIGRKHSLTLLRSDRAMTDCRPVSLCSLATVGQLGNELGTELDKRRFRANIYLNLEAAGGFAEDDFVDQRLQIGSKAVVSVLERDPRCAMITIDPETAKRDPAILKQVTQAHDGMTGVYAAVLVEGRIQPGDNIKMLE